MNKWLKNNFHLITHIISEQAQTQAQDVEPLEDSSSQSQERLTRTSRNHPIDLVMGNPSSGVRTRRRQYASFLNITRLFLAWNPQI